MEEVRWCDVCTERNAVIWCIDCTCYLCEPCDAAHSHFKSTKNHHILTVEEMRYREAEFITAKMQDYCSEHVDEVVKFYCTTCAKAVCRECNIVTHDGHALIPLADEARVQRQVLRSHKMLTESKIEDLATAVQQANAYKDSVLSNKQLTIVDIQLQAEKMKKSIDEYSTQLITSITERCIMEENITMEYTTTLQKMAENIKSTVDFAGKVLSCGTSYDVVTMATRVREELTNLHQEPIPSMNQKLSKINFQEAEFDQDVLKKQFGSVAMVTEVDLTDLEMKSEKSYSSVSASKCSESTSASNFGIDNAKIRPKLLQTLTLNSTSEREDFVMFGMFNCVTTPDEGYLVADELTSRASLYSSTGELIYDLGRSSEVKVQRVWDVAVLSESCLVVSDADDGDIKVYDTEGQFINSIGKGLLSEPHGVTTNEKSHIIVTNLDRCTFSREDRWQKNALFIFTSQGSLLQTICGTTTMPLFKNPGHVTTNIKGNIIVSDPGDDSIKAFSENGQFLWRYSFEGYPAETFGNPAGLCTDSSGYTIAADRNLDRIVLLDQEGRFLQVLLSKVDGITLPSSVHLTNHGILVVGQEGGTLKLFCYDPDDQNSFFDETDDDDIYDDKISSCDKKTYNTENSLTMSDPRTDPTLPYIPIGY